MLRVPLPNSPPLLQPMPHKLPSLLISKLKTTSGGNRRDATPHNQLRAALFRKDY